jgi:integrase
MSSIAKRELAKKNGKRNYVWDATVSKKKNGEFIFREKQTFKLKANAISWARDLETKLEAGTTSQKKVYISVKKVFERYMRDFNGSYAKSRYLKHANNRPFGELDVHKLTTSDIVSYFIERNEFVAPASANIEYGYLRVTFKTMKPVMDLQLDMSIFSEAKELLTSEGFLAPSVKRDRLPTPQELWQLSRELSPESRDVMWFALYSARRRGEIFTLRWDDLNREKRTIRVRDLKHPKLKNLSKVAKIPRPAYKIILRQEQIGEYIFSVNVHTHRKHWENAKKKLGIEDLHFHDLRHAALTHIASKGLSIPQIKLVSLHDTSASLERYVNLKAEDLDI